MYSHVVRMHGNFSQSKSQLFILCFGLCIFYVFYFYFLFTSTSVTEHTENTEITENKIVLHFENFDHKVLTNFDQKDRALLPLVVKHYVVEPSTLPYEIRAHPNGIIQTIWPILKKIVDEPGKGFFVEAGAYDGISASNTFWLEQVHGWSGLLVECHPDVVPLLLQKHRKAYVSNACLSRFSHPEVAELTSVDGWHPSSSLKNDKANFPDFAKTFSKFTVQTIPLYALLASINVTTVDFISLDIQSLEYEVLKQFPFDLIRVKVWLIEVDLIPPQDQLKLRKLMKENDYDGPSHPSESDRLFVHNSLRNKFS